MRRHVNAAALAAAILLLATGAVQGADGDKPKDEAWTLDANNWPLYGDLIREAREAGGVAIYAHGGYAQAIYADVVQGNLDSVELGATDIDQYVESLGGMNRVITRAKGREVPVYLGDHTGKDGRVRTLGEQVALETRTRMLNPKWYEAQLAQGYEGARNIAGHVATTLGWSATAGNVPQWVYTDITNTFVLDPAMRERLA